MTMTWVLLNLGGTALYLRITIILALRLLSVFVTDVT